VTRANGAELGFQPGVLGSPPTHRNSHEVCPDESGPRAIANFPDASSGRAGSGAAIPTINGPVAANPATTTNSADLRFHPPQLNPSAARVAPPKTANGPRANARIGPAARNAGYTAATDHDFCFAKSTGAGRSSGFSAHSRSNNSTASSTDNSCRNTCAKHGSGRSGRPLARGDVGSRTECCLQA
jgi:hypothetical protein